MITIGLVRFIDSISSALQVLEKYKDINVKTFLTSAVTYGTYNGGKGRPFSAKLEGHRVATLVKNVTHDGNDL